MPDVSLFLVLTFLRILVVTVAISVAAVVVAVEVVGGVVDACGVVDGGVGGGGVLTVMLRYPLPFQVPHRLPCDVVDVVVVVSFCHPCVGGGLLLLVLWLLMWLLWLQPCRCLHVHAPHLLPLLPLGLG